MSALAILAAALALVSIALNAWQWWLGRQFGRRTRTTPVADEKPFTPSVSVLKPLKGSDAHTEACLESWFLQDYPAPVQLLFAVAAPDDPAKEVVEKLQRKYPDREAKLVLAQPVLGPNGKVSSLCHLSNVARFQHLVISDADVFVKKEFLSRLIPELRDESVGLVNCFYIFGAPKTFAARLEAIAVNADFWTSVLQGISLRRMDFALGAVMATRQSELLQIGGLERLLELLADDYQLGHEIAAFGKQVAISPLRVECREANQSSRAVMRRQLRWARTVRVCRPAGYFFSILGNATLWPVAAVIAGAPGAWWLLAIGLATRMLGAISNYRELAGRCPWWVPMLAPVKDTAQLLLWVLSLTGSVITWHDQRFHVSRGGKLTPLA